MIKTLNPTTLKDDPNGEQYEVEKTGDCIIISASSQTPETPTTTTETPTLEDKINYLYYKSMGVI